MGGRNFTFFKVCFGVRQGFVLSPCLFALYLDDLAVKWPSNWPLQLCNLYADDIIIIILSTILTELQRQLNACEKRADLAWHVYKYKKSRVVCALVTVWTSKCSPIVTLNDYSLPWVNELRYLGIFITSLRTFKCSLDCAKRAYYRSLNASFGKMGWRPSEEVVLQLIVATKCLPIAMNGSEACRLTQFATSLAGDNNNVQSDSSAVLLPFMLSCIIIYS
jgi:Reverse transcriptase (RNA-dependent DNA polymerase)